MSMFDNYQNIDKSVDICNPYAKDYQLQQKPRMPLELLNAKNEFIGYGWHQGEPIVLEFITTGSVQFDDQSWEEAKDYMYGKICKFELFNFRYEKVYETDIPADEIVNVVIDCELSNAMCKGMYYGRLTLIDLEHKLTYVLIDNDICKFFVK